MKISLSSVLSHALCVALGCALFKLGVVKDQGKHPPHTTKNQRHKNHPSQNTPPSTRNASILPQPHDQEDHTPGALGIVFQSHNPLVSKHKKPPPPLEPLLEVRTLPRPQASSLVSRSLQATTIVEIGCQEFGNCGGGQQESLLNFVCQSSYTVTPPTTPGDRVVVLLTEDINCMNGLTAGIKRVDFDPADRSYPVLIDVRAGGEDVTLDCQGHRLDLPLSLNNPTRHDGVAVVVGRGVAVQNCVFVGGWDGVMIYDDDPAAASSTLPTIIQDCTMTGMHDAGVFLNNDSDPPPAQLDLERLDLSHIEDGVYGALEDITGPINIRNITARNIADTVIELYYVDGLVTIEGLTSTRSAFGIQMEGGSGNFVLSDLDLSIVSKTAVRLYPYQAGVQLVGERITVSQMQDGMELSEFSGDVSLTDVTLDGVARYGVRQWWGSVMTIENLDVTCRLNGGVGDTIGVLSEEWPINQAPANLTWEVTLINSAIAQCSQGVVIIGDGNRRRQRQLRALAPTTVLEAVVNDTTVSLCAPSVEAQFDNTSHGVFVDAQALVNLNFHNFVVGDTCNKTFGQDGGTVNIEPAPTDSPTENSPPPTDQPTTSPTRSPTGSPVTNMPTVSPTDAPTSNPTTFPTVSPTHAPTDDPTDSPTVSPSSSPTQRPTVSPTDNPTVSPTVRPTPSPTADGPAPTLLWEDDFSDFVNGVGNDHWLDSDPSSNLGVFRTNPSGLPCGGCIRLRGGTDATLPSTVIDMTGRTQVELLFQFYTVGADTGQNDNFVLEARFDGTSYDNAQLAGPSQTFLMVNSATPVNQTVLWDSSTANFQTGEPSLFVRFRNPSNNGNDRIYITLVRVTASAGAGNVFS